MVLTCCLAAASRRVCAASVLLDVYGTTTSEPMSTSIPAEKPASAAINHQLRLHARCRLCRFIGSSAHRYKSVVS